MPSKTDVRRLPKANNHAAPYHHGDLRDALIAAAQDIMETEGLAALSLRAVSRRAVGSKMHNSIFAAWAEKTAKFMPKPSHVAPSGLGAPGSSRSGKAAMAYPS